MARMLVSGVFPAKCDNGQMCVPIRGASARLRPAAMRGAALDMASVPAPLSPPGHLLQFLFPNYM